MTYQTEFPDYPVASMPAIPEGFTDRSWRNEACPCFIHEASGVMLLIGYPDPEQRDWDGARFLAMRCPTYHPEAGWQIDGEMIELFESDDWATVERSLPNFIKPALAAIYAERIGYDPFADDPSITIAEVAQALIEHANAAGVAA